MTAQKGGRAVVTIDVMKLDFLVEQVVKNFIDLAPTLAAHANTPDDRMRTFRDSSICDLTWAEGPLAVPGNRQP